jgi:hypothetical protein
VAFAVQADLFAVPILDKNLQAFGLGAEGKIGKDNNG